MVAELQEKFPETSDYAERGNVVDAQCTAELLGRGVATDPDAVACLAALRALMETA
jgi:hypothetical protein